MMKIMFKSLAVILTALSLVTGDCDIKECELDDGTCIANQTTWQKGCGSKRCDVIKMGDFYEKQILIVNFACVAENGTCIANGTSWTENCITRQCVITPTRYGYTSSIDIVSFKCSIEGHCVDVGEKVVSSQNPCSQYTCQLNNYHLSAVLDSKCRMDNGTCVSDKSTWEDNCVTKQCQVSKVGNVLFAGIKFMELKCPKGDGGCAANKTTWEDSCYTKLCTITLENNVWSLKTSITSRVSVMNR